MNWNGYDTKYIIKRLIIGFGMLILFSILTTNKAKALSMYSGSLNPNNVYLTTSTGLESTFNTSALGITNNQFSGAGQGVLYFSLFYYNNTETNRFNGIYEIAVNNATDRYVCNIGDQATYIDEGQKRNQIISVECPVNFSSSGLRSISIKKIYTDIQVSITFSKSMTFFNDSSDNSQQIINTITSQTQQVVSGLTNNTQIQEDLTQDIINNQNTNAQQAHQDAQNINNSINNDNVTTSDADDFKNNQAFTDSTGLESVINLPLNMVNSLSNECQPIQIHIPYIETDATIPCMSTIYRSKFNSLYTLVKLVVNGFLVYRILLKVYELVHEAKQPDEDKLEVIEL